MVGIASYGAYVPRWRLPLAALGGGRRGGPGRGEKAVANFDEDSVTMAVAAGLDCLAGIPRDTVDGVLFASTSYPYKEKLGASIIAKALDLRRKAREEGMFTLRESGLCKVREGVTSIEEVVRETVK